jgi:hypothetical protein
MLDSMGDSRNELTQHAQGGTLGECASLDGYRWRHPVREGHRFCNVPTRRSVFLLELRELIRTKVSGRSDQSGPQTPMNERDFAGDEPACKDLVRGTD